MTYRKQITDTLAVLRPTERMVLASDEATDETLWVAPVSSAEKKSSEKMRQHFG
ncbi:MAG: hypothetical protein Q4A49_00725 [Neisseria sp.]|nr:hypothetical protein [Neisseria sp.]